MPKSTVLIIENDLKLKESMMNSIEKLGYKALACGRTNEAMQLLAEMKSTHILILAKFHMPDLSGNDFLKQARLKNFNVSVCLYSYQIERAELIGALQLGALDFIQAPLSSAFFEEKIPRLIEISNRLGRVKPTIESNQVTYLTAEQKVSLSQSESTEKKAV